MPLLGLHDPGCHTTAILCAHSLAHVHRQSRRCSNPAERVYILLHSIWFPCYLYLHAHTNACERSQHQVMFAPQEKEPVHRPPLPSPSLRNSQGLIRFLFAPASQTPLSPLPASHLLETRQPQLRPSATLQLLRDWPSSSHCAGRGGWKGGGGGVFIPRGRGGGAWGARRGGCH